MTHFDKFSWRNWLQKILMQIVVVWKDFYKFALMHWIYLLLVRKNNARGNNMPFMNKSLTKAHMKIIRLRNLYLKKKLTQAELHTSSNAGRPLRKFK